MSGAVEGVALREALMAWEPEGDDRVRPLLLAEADRRDALEYNVSDANHVIAFLLHRLDAARTTPPARSYADGVRDAAAVVDAEYDLRKHHHAANKAAGNKKEARDFETMMIAHTQSAAAIRLLSQKGKA